MEHVKQAIEKQRTYFESGKTLDVDFRIQQLKKLKRVIKSYAPQIEAALKKDLSKSAFETYETEIGFALEELGYIIKHLPKWAKRKRVRTPLKHFLSKSHIQPEPYGVTLVISPWNFPFNLAVSPLIGAIAAGNTVILKPSEYSPNTSDVLERIIRETFDEGHAAVIQGGKETSEAVLEEEVDYIFFTGSTEVGQIVMEAASKQLTPVTLELGGKSPGIVDETANLNIAARRLAWGKFINAGQTCVAPDYLLVHSSIKDELIQKMKQYITSFYGQQPIESEDFPKIINKKHFDRLNGLLEGADIVFGGERDEAANKIAPTLIDNVSWDSALMEDEIFGPLLPVLTFDDLDEAIEKVKSRPKPLALYYFSTDKKRQDYITTHVSFGGGCINDTITHLATPYMPFGGVGKSGMGSYHGKASFDTFTHNKSLLTKSNVVDVPLRYPPYNKKKMALLKMALR